MMPPQSTMPPARAPHRRGLTLLELVAVIAIIAVLFVITLEAISRSRERIDRTRCLHNMRSVGQLILLYSMENGGNLLPSLADVDQGRGTPWYAVLDERGVLSGRPDQAGSWNNKAGSPMACPSRPDLPRWSGNSSGATLHYGMNQFPGFLNRTGKPGSATEQTYLSRYGNPEIGRIEAPQRTFLLGEVTNTYNTWPLDNDRNAYPHPPGSDGVLSGAGMNLFFYDGHAEYFKGRLPVLGNVTSLKAADWKPEESYPFF